MPRLSVLLFLICLLCGSARAETPGDVPNPQRARRSWVADNAEVLSDQSVARLDALIGRVKRKTGAEIAVVTVKNLNGYAVDDFANLLFNRWGVGRKGHDDGVLILAAMQEHKIRIEVGDGLESTLTDERAAQIIGLTIAPRFKAKDFDAGLYNGTLAVARRIAPSLDAAATTPNTAKAKATAKTKSKAKAVAKTKATAKPKPTPKPTARAAPLAGSSSSSSSPGVSFGGPSYGISSSPGVGIAPLLVLALLGGGVLVAVLALGSRPPKCPHCQSALELVPESGEDAFLTDIQQLEESLGGREWNVWRCPRDGYLSVLSHDKWFNSIADCPLCHHHTATSNAQMLSYATEFQTGLEQTAHVCQNPDCRHAWTTQRIIPRDVPTPIHHNSSSNSGFSGSSFSDSGSSGSSSHSSHDSGGSFGGGHSSGGGASGDW